MNTTFKPSEFDKQTAASIDMLDVDVAQERVAAILHPHQAGPTLTPAPQTPPQAPALKPDLTGAPLTSAIVNDPNFGKPAPNRKPRSDKGIPKRPTADPDEIVLRMNLDSARMIPFALAKGGDLDAKALAWHLQDQIIAQLQKRLDLLTRQK